jgi:hypothetical protein
MSHDLPAPPGLRRLCVVSKQITNEITAIMANPTPPIAPLSSPSPIRPKNPHPRTAHHRTRLSVRPHRGMRDMMHLVLSAGGRTKFKFSWRVELGTCIHTQYVYVRVVPSDLVQQPHIQRGVSSHKSTPVLCTVSFPPLCQLPPYNPEAPTHQAVNNPRRSSYWPAGRAILRLSQ